MLLSVLIYFCAYEAIANKATLRPSLRLKIFSIQETLYGAFFVSNPRQNWTFMHGRYDQGCWNYIRIENYDEVKVGTRYVGMSSSGEGRKDWSITPGWSETFSCASFAYINFLLSKPTESVLWCDNPECADRVLFSVLADYHQASIRIFPRWEWASVLCGLIK